MNHFFNKTRKKSRIEKKRKKGGWGGVGKEETRKCFFSGVESVWHKWCKFATSLLTFHFSLPHFGFFLIFLINCWSSVVVSVCVATVCAIPAVFFFFFQKN